uniref:Chemokine interleukin-8-like domain-containing protein n=1 Tax=Cyclopterus lumpus TaxID=8103 RepID=A0A8C2XBR1_CYCLU
ATMRTGALLLLVTLTLCGITSLHALPRPGCVCIRTRSSRVPLGVVRRIQLIPVSGLCRRTEVIVTRRNGSKVCVDPKEKWVNELLSNLAKK